MGDLGKAITTIEETLDKLISAKNAYETRLGALINRFDGSMQSDYATLVDERKKLQTQRKVMEASAKATLYVTALEAMDALERMMNDIDASLGDLMKLEKQYNETYAQFKDALDKVVACDHVELKIKKDPIIALRDDMLKAATESEFETALQKARALIPLVEEFGNLEAMLKDYARRHGTLLPRLKTVREYTYKSLDDNKVALEKAYTEMTDRAEKAWFKEALEKMTLVEDIIANMMSLNTDLMLQEAVYKKLKDDLQDKVGIVRNNTIEEAQTAADKVTTAFDALVELGEKDEFIAAIPKADEVKKLIEAYLKKVDEFGDQKEAYEILRDVALVAYGNAEQKSKDYEEALKTPFGDLTKIKVAMEKSASSDEYGDAKVQAKNLISEIKTFDATWAEQIEIEASLDAWFKTLNTQFDALPGDAEKLADAEYTAVKAAKTKAGSSLGDRNFEQAIEDMNAYEDAFKDLNDALKTNGEHKTEYEGHFDSLQPRYAATGDSDFAEKLTVEIEAFEEAFDAMVITADNEDYEGAVKKASDVEKALVTFDTAENELESGRDKFKERMEGLQKRLEDARKVADETLTARVGALNAAEKAANDLAGDHEYTDALERAKALKIEIEAILDESERLEDEQAKEDGEKKGGEECSDDDKEAEDDEGITDKIFDYAVDKALEKAKDIVIKKVGVVGGTLINVGEELLDGDPLDALVEAGKGVVKLHPVTDVVKTAIEIADDVLDASDVILGDDD